jgi:hypothetical protein
MVHAHANALPRLGVVYRCPVCRLELAFDPTLNEMRPSSLPASETAKQRRTA